MYGIIRVKTIMWRIVIISCTTMRKGDMFTDTDPQGLLLEAP